MKITKTLLYKSSTLWVTNSNKHLYITTKELNVLVEKQILMIVSKIRPGPLFWPGPQPELEKSAGIRTGTGIKPEPSPGSWLTKI